MTLFHMCNRYRKTIIESHNFYIEQSNKRLLTQFDNIDKEADQYGEEWLEKTNSFFDPERHDPGDFYEQAYEESINFHQMLSEMSNQTRLSVIAGIYHQWDKQLRSWMVRELGHWHQGDKLKKAVWKATFEDVIDLSEALGWSIRSKQYYNILNKYRLVVNAYKHGEGDSFDAIKNIFPELLNYLKTDEMSFLEYASHDDLVVQDKHIQEFSESIIQFWEDVPEYIQNKGEYEYLPKWFEEAYTEDMAEIKNSAN